MDIQAIIAELGDPVEIINAADATEILRAQGWKISADNVRRGIHQGVFPWGTCIMNDDTPRVFVYVRPLMRWIQEQKEGAA